MVPFYARFKREDFEKLKGPGFLFAGGFLAGLLIFLVWLAFRPDAGKELVTAQPATVAGIAQKPLSADDGVLAGISDPAEPAARAGAVGQASDDGASADQHDGAELAGRPGNEPGEARDADGFERVSDGQAIAEGLLDAPSREDDEPEPDPQADFNEPAPSR